MSPQRVRLAPAGPMESMTDGSVNTSELKPRGRPCSTLLAIAIGNETMALMAAKRWKDWVLVIVCLPSRG